MEIKENGAWVQNDDGYSGHHYVQKISDIINKIVLEEQPALVCDFGCGLGEYIKNVNKMGFEAIGFEAYPDKTSYQNIEQADLSQPLILDRKADISISLEVGEHIPEQFEQTYIDNICNNTNNTIILSWAIPGQGGDGHVNEKEDDYIIDQITKRGFVLDDAILNIRKEEDNLLWFHNTLMLFRKP